MSNNKLLITINKFLDKFTETVPEKITDNGLNEDYVAVKQVKPVTQVAPVELVQSTVEAPVQKESKKLFTLSKSSNNEAQQRMEHVEVNHSLSNLLTSTSDISATKSNTEPVAEKTVSNTKGCPDKETMTTEEFEKIFDENLKARDEQITGFADACFDTIEGIQSNRVISEERKIEKITNLEKEFLEISNDDFDAICLFFKKVRHELHMIQNNVGEYDNRVYMNGLINNPKIKNYRIAEMHMDDELYKYLAEEDVNAMENLLDMCEEIHKMAKKCDCLNKYVQLTDKRLLSCNTVLDLMVAKEKFNDMLIDLNVKINTSNDSSLLA